MKLWPFNRSEKHTRPSANRLLSMPLFRANNPIEFGRVFQIVNELDPVRKVQMEANDDQGRQSAEFKLGESRAILAMMTMPVPGDEVAQNARNSQTWNQASSVEHDDHAVLIGSTESNMTELLMLCSRVAVASLKAHDGIGWYVGSACAVHAPEFAWDLVKTADGEWPGVLPLWVQILISQDDPGVWSASTIGMEAFGHRDFEAVSCRTEPRELREWIFDLCSYVIDQGPILLHGQTFGRTAEDRWKIEVGKSKLGKAGTVIRIGIP